MLERSAGRKKKAKTLTDGQSYLNKVKKIEPLSAEEQYELARTVDIGSTARVQLEEMEMELDDDTVDKLYELVEEGDKARQKLLESYTQMVVSIARKTVPNGGSNPCFMDAVQEGNLGLIHAMDLYDINSGTKFGTYAYFWIRNYISAFISNQRSITVPDKLVTVYNRIRQTETELSVVLHRDPTYAEVAAELNMEEDRVKMCIAQCEMEAFSLDETVASMPGVQTGDGDTTMGEVLPNDYGAFGGIPEDQVVDAETAALQTEVVRDEMSKVLRDQERAILLRYFGFMDGSPHSLRGIARELGITPSRVGQVKKEAVKKLRRNANLRALYQSTV